MKLGINIQNSKILELVFKMVKWIYTELKNTTIPKKQCIQIINEMLYCFIYEFVLNSI